MDNTDVKKRTSEVLQLTCPSADILDPFTTPPLAQGELLSPFTTPPLRNEQYSHDDSSSPFVTPLRDSENEWEDEESVLQEPAPPTAEPVYEVEYEPSVPDAEMSHILNPPDGRSSLQTPGMRNSLQTPDIRASLLTSSSVPPERLTDATIEELRNACIMLEQEKDNLRQQLMSAQHEIDMLRSEGESLMDDHHFQVEMKALKADVKRWSSKFFRGTARSRRWPTFRSTEAQFGHLTYNFAGYLKSARNRPFLIQAYLWYALRRRVFHLHPPGGYTWAGKFGDKYLRRIDQHVRPTSEEETDLREYNKWRSLTLNLLVPGIDSNPTPRFDTIDSIRNWADKRITRRVWKRLKPYSTTDDQRAARQELKHIVYLAVRLDLQMKSQRAEFQVWEMKSGGVSYGFPLAEEQMVEPYDDGEGDPESKRVQLVIAPALLKWGDNAGLGYENCSVLLKAEVLCDRVQSEFADYQSRNGSKGFRKFLSR